MASSPKEMPRVDMGKEFANMSSSDQHFIKKMEKLNTDRAKTVMKMRGRNLLVGALLGTGAVAICILSTKLASTRVETVTISPWTINV